MTFTTHCFLIASKCLKSSDGNGDSACCAFPFKYRGKTYNSCTKKDHNQLWCSTTSDYDKNKRWGNCSRCRIILIILQGTYDIFFCLLNNVAYRNSMMNKRFSKKMLHIFQYHIIPISLIMILTSPRKGLEYTYMINIWYISYYWQIWENAINRA